MSNSPRFDNTYTVYGYAAQCKSQLGFNGEHRDLVVGLYPLGNGHRMYSPALMRFYSPDILSPFDIGGHNAYAYCLSDPVNRTDASGRSPSLFAKFKSWLSPYKDSSVASWELTGKSLFPRRSVSEPDFTAGRSVINEYTRKLSSSTPFIDKLATVNNNLASHGDSSLSPQHAVAYVGIAQRNKSGSISNTSAHLLASQEWMKEQGAPRVVGTFFNLGGALGAGVEDHALLKTGKTLQMTQHRVRDGIENARTKKSPPV